MLFKGFYKAPFGILVTISILKEMLPFGFIYKTVRRNEFDVDLDTLSRISHLLIGFGNMLRIRRMNSHNPLFAEETVKSWDGTGIARLHKLYSEHDQPGIRVASAHIHDKLDLHRSVLVRMVMWSS